MLLLGIALAVVGVVAIGSLLVARGARARATQLERVLTQRAGPVTKCSPSEHHPGGRPDREGEAMATVNADLRLGAGEVIRRDTRSVVAYLTGAGLIALGVLLHDHLPYKGATLAAVGGAIMFAAIFVPPIAAKITDRPRPDITDELADLENAWLDRFAVQDQRWAERLDELQGIVAAARDQLR